MDGIDKLFAGMRASSTGLTIERTRIDIIAENIANARTTQTPEGGAYRRKLVIFDRMFEDALGSDVSHGVARPSVVEDFRTPFERIMDPSHPDAGEDGFVEYPNVNTVMEMADLITAMRAYEANITAQQNFVRMAERALELLR